MDYKDYYATLGVGKKASADDIQKAQLFFLANCRDQTAVINQVQRLFDWIEQVVSLLTDNVYITIDLDVFDPSIMPATRRRTSTTRTPSPSPRGNRPPAERLTRCAASGRNLTTHF